MDVFVPSVKWIPLTIAHSIVTLINFIIFKNEMKQRKVSTVKFVNRSMQYTSLLCIIFAFAGSVFNTLVFINGFCLFSLYLLHLFLCWQLVAMGCYQLSRLYYAFSNSRIHSNKGYPKWIFITMIIISILFIIAPIFRITLTRSSCGLNQKWEYNQRFIESDDDYNISVLYTWWAILSLMAIWDIITLCLYIYKLNYFKRCYNEKQPMVYKRIMVILSKIITLTLFYQLVFIWQLIIGFVNNIIGSFPELYLLLVVLSMTALSLSVYLMMDHNQQQYLEFLNCLYWCKFNYVCCCCCGKMVYDQMIELDLKDAVSSQGKVTSNEEKEAHEATEYETRDLDGNDPEILSSGNELSIESTIQVPKEPYN